jgi:hypothetical protein
LGRDNTPTHKSQGSQTALLANEGLPHNKLELKKHTHETPSCTYKKTRTMEDREITSLTSATTNHLKPTKNDGFQCFRATFERDCSETLETSILFRVNFGIENTPQKTDKTNKFYHLKKSGFLPPPHPAPQP